MSKSIMQTDKVCYFCASEVGLERHHVFAGVANRKISERAGLWVWLCHECHTGANGAQYNKAKNNFLKMAAQTEYERNHTRADWMKLIGKNYL